jgi:hypothetical protein
MTRTILLVTVLSLPALNAVAAPEPSAERADALIKRMSAYVSDLKTFRVRSDAVDEVVTTDGEKLQFVSASQVAVKRPNLVRSDRVGAMANVTFRYDGKTFSVHGNRSGYYATAPAPATLVEAVDVARERLGLELPAADLVVVDSYARLLEEVVSARYIGLEPIDGTPCHHLALRGKEVDLQLWIEDGPKPLPRRYVITSKEVAGTPEHTVTLSRWETNVPISDSAFAFSPPKGGQRIEFTSPRAAREGK